MRNRRNTTDYNLLHRISSMTTNGIKIDDFKKAGE